MVSIDLSEEREEYAFDDPPIVVAPKETVPRSTIGSTEILGIMSADKVEDKRNRRGVACAYSYL
jgi:hypothetical protein